jgi:perosamine synthetase
MKLILPDLGNKEIELIAEVFESGVLTNDKMVSNFESAVALYTGVKHAVGVSSGTAALHLAFVSSGIGKGDEVIVPAFCFVGSVNTLMYLQARPVAVDININTLNIDIRELEMAITPKTKAILAVDLFGVPVEIDKIRELADKNNLILIEDASYAFGSRYNSMHCGSQADVAVLSFNERRIITSAEGGMLLTNDETIAEKARLLRNHAMQRDDKHKAAKFEYVGYNYRMSEVHAAIGLGQMGKIDNIIEQKRRLGKEYTKLLESVPNVTPQREPQGCCQNYHNYVIKLDVNIDVDALKKRLEEREITTTIGTYCVHYQPMYNIKGKFPVAEYAYEYGISLPINSKMTIENVQYICEIIERFVS